MTPEPARSYEMEWLSIKTDVSFSPDARGISAVDQTGRTRGVVAFDSWTPNGCQVHMAIDTPIAARCLLPAAADYVFNHACRKLVWMFLYETREKSRKLAESLGFRETYRVKDGWAEGRDIIFFELRRDDCRILTEKAVK